MYSPEYRVFVHHLRAAIQSSEIQQVDLAARIGKSQSYISKALAGYQSLTLVEAWTLLNAADVSFVEWVTELDAALRQEALKTLKEEGTQKEQSAKLKVAAAKPQSSKVSNRS